MNEQPQQVPTPEVQPPAAPTPPPVMPVVTETPKSKKKLVIGVVALLLLVGAGLSWFFLMQPPKAEPTPVTTEDTQLQPEEVTTKIKSELAKDYTVQDIAINNKPSAKEVSVRVEKISPAYKVDGYVYYNNYEGGSTMTILTSGSLANELPAASDQDTRVMIAKTYTDFGLTKQTTTGDTNQGSSIDAYTGKGLICTVESKESAISASTASCGLIANYADAAAKLGPLATALKVTDTDAYLSNLVIKDSKVAGYQHGSLAVGSIKGGGGARALLYKKGDAAWMYFKSTQDILQCSDFNTADLRSAFKGEPCIDSNTVETVVQ